MVCQDSALSMGYGVDQDEMEQGVVLNVHIKTKISVKA